MKKLTFVFIAFLTLINLNAQIKEPVKWTSKTEKISDTEFNLIATGIIEPEWHVYSQLRPHKPFWFQIAPQLFYQFPTFHLMQKELYRYKPLVNIKAKQHQQKKLTVHWNQNQIQEYFLPRFIILLKNYFPKMNI